MVWGCEDDAPEGRPRCSDGESSGWRFANQRPRNLRLEQWGARSITSGVTPQDSRARRRPEREEASRLEAVCRYRLEEGRNEKLSICEDAYDRGYDDVALNKLWEQIAKQCTGYIDSNRDGMG